MKCFGLMDQNGSKKRWMLTISSTHCQCAICERSDIKWAKVEHRVDGDKMEKFSPVQNLSMSSSCCLVAKTHIGSGAASLRWMQTSSVDMQYLHSRITSASVSDDSPVLFTFFLALFTCLRFCGRSQPVFALMIPPWSFSMPLRTWVADLYSKSF